MYPQYTESLVYLDAFSEVLRLIESKAFIALLQRSLACSDQLRFLQMFRPKSFSLDSACSSLPHKLKAPSPRKESIWHLEVLSDIFLVAHHSLALSIVEVSL